MTEIDEIKLIPGDIKGNFDDECGDGVVDIDDFVIVLRGFVENGSDGVENAVDINEDGNVNVTDIAMVKKNFGKSCNN